MKENLSKNSKTSEKNIKKALLLKALGYDAVETIEEYSNDDGEVKLTKKKVTTKNVPPDVSALKLLLEQFNERSIESMTDEELEEEKQELLEKIIKNNDKGEKLCRKLKRKKTSL